MYCVWLWIDALSRNCEINKTLQKRSENEQRPGKKKKKKNAWEAKILFLIFIFLQNFLSFARTFYIAYFGFNCFIRYYIKAWFPSFLGAITRWHALNFLSLNQIKFCGRRNFFPPSFFLFLVFPLFADCNTHNFTQTFFLLFIVGC